MPTLPMRIRHAVDDICPLPILRLRPQMKEKVSGFPAPFCPRGCRQNARAGDKTREPPFYPHTTATHLLRAGVDINTVRGWLGRVSLDTANIYAEIDFETKAKAAEKCEAPDMGKVPKRWRDQPARMDFLRSLKPFCYVAPKISWTHAVSGPYRSTPHNNRDHITHKMWPAPFYAGKPHVRICAGGAKSCASLPRSAHARQKQFANTLIYLRRRPSVIASVSRSNLGAAQLRLAALSQPAAGRPLDRRATR